MDLKKNILIVLLIIYIIISVLRFKKKEHFENGNEKLKLECVLTAVNENEMYLDFIPLFIKSWNKFYPEVDIKIILIAEKIPEKFMKYQKNIIVFTPENQEISTAFISQFIRLLYPCLLKNDNGVMITDIDSIPLNYTYFKDNLKNIEKDRWVNYRDWKEHKQIAMCWQIATPKTWREVFKINNVDDINRKLEEVNSRINYKDGSTDSGWFTDQYYLYEKVMDWNKKTNKYLFLKDRDTGYKRLDRIDFKDINTNIKKNLENGRYSDYHLHRPAHKFEKINNEIVDLVL